MDLNVFFNDNERAKAARRRVNWVDRLDLIHEQFGPLVGADWSMALRDNDVFARIVRDILKAQQHAERPEAERSLAGRRPNLSPGPNGMRGWRELTGNDFSELMFIGAFRAMTCDRATGKEHSLSHIAHKTGISRSRVHRLLRGEEEPTLTDMRTIAAAYNRKPAYFNEYRAAAIAAFIMEKLRDAPETSASLYQRIIQ